MSDALLRGAAVPAGRISALLPVVAFDAERGLFFLEDQSLGFAFDGAPLAGADHNAGGRFNTLLNQDWPPGTLMQFALWTSPDLAPVLGPFESRRQGTSEHPTLGAYTRAVRAFLEEGTARPVSEALDTRVRDLRLVITVKLPVEGEPTPAELDRAVKLKQAVARGLHAVGIRARPLDAAGYVRLMETLLNWGDGQPAWRLGPTEIDPLVPLNEQVADYDCTVEVTRDGVRVGGRFVKTLSAKRLPRQGWMGMAAAYLGDTGSGTRGIREPVLITANIHFPDSQRLRGQMERKRQWTVNQAYGPLLKFVPELARKKAGFDVLHEAFLEGDRPVQVYLGLAIFGDDERSAVAAASNARTYWAEQGFQLLEDRFVHLPCLLNLLPFGADRQAVLDLRRYKTMATRHAIQLLPVFGDWKGTGTGDFFLISRNGQLMSLSLYDSDASYNAVIAAQSGSGKSFLTNEIIAAYLALGGQVWCIDVGRSYAKAVEVYGGDLLDFERGRPVCINPFPLVADYAEEEDILAGLVVAMAAPTQSLSDLQMAELKRALKACWERHGRGMTVDHLAAELAASDDQRIRDVGRQLYPWTSQGEYGRYMAGENSIRFDKPFTVLELEALKHRRHLQQVVLLELVYQIQQHVYRGDRDRPKLVILDEAWQLLAAPNVGQFINDAYRRFRKYGASAIVILQSVADLYENPVGRAIAENSPNMYLLAQKADAIEALREHKRLPIPEGAYGWLKTVHTVVGAYSEVFAITGRGMGVGRFVVDPYRQLLYSTLPEDVAAFQRKRAEGLGVHEAIEALLRERGHAA